MNDTRLLIGFGIVLGMFPFYAIDTLLYHQFDISLGLYSLIGYLGLMIGGTAYTLRGLKKEEIKNEL